MVSQENYHGLQNAGKKPLGFEGLSSHLMHEAGERLMQKRLEWELSEDKTPHFFGFLMTTI